MNFSKGQFGFDLDFLKKYFKPVVLSQKNGKQQIIVVPEIQGRVLTSTSNGAIGKSFGWINHELIASQKIAKHINQFGGEDRFWMGPEAGQFGLFFKHGDEFTFENSQVPSVIDTEAFELVKHEATNVELVKETSLINYANTEFKIRINRKINLLSDEQIEQALQIGPDNNLNVVGFESRNTITNLGTDWKKNTGLLSIWIIGVFNATNKTTVIIPLQNSDWGINANYFGALDETRLQLKDDTVFFKGDGSFRSKIGINPRNTKPVFGSYDFENDVLTIVQFNFANDECYVNSMWEVQKDPYAGDVINSYNDGPLNTSEKQLGSFYELETSSPGKELKSGESITHAHQTFHFSGDKKTLTALSRRLLNADIKTDPLMMH